MPKSLADDLPINVVSSGNATIELVLIWPASAQTDTQHAASLVQCHRQLIENHLVPQSLSMKTNGPSNAGVGTDGRGVELEKKRFTFVSLYTP